MGPGVLGPVDAVAWAPTGEPAAVVRVGEHRPEAGQGGVGALRAVLGTDEVPEGVDVRESRCDVRPHPDALDVDGGTPVQERSQPGRAPHRRTARIADGLELCVCRGTHPCVVCHIQNATPDCDPGHTRVTDRS